MSKLRPKFKRTDAVKYSKLGVRRKNKQVYRKAKGRDNKIRLNMKGHTKNVKVGFRSEKAKRDLINGMEVVMVFNVKDLENLKDGKIGVVGKVGAKNKMEIVKKADEMKIKLVNVDSEKFLKELEEKMKERKEARNKRESNKKARDKKAKETESKKEEKKESDEKKTENKEESKTEVKDSKVKETKMKDTKKEIQTNNYGRGK